MKNNENRHIEERIHAYVQGKLTDEEADALWAEIMEKPELLELLKVNVNLQKLFDSKSLQDPEFSSTEKETGKTASVQTLYSRHKVWITALAAMILITLGLNLLQTDHHPMMVSALDEVSLLELETVPVTRSQAVFLTGADSLLFFAYEAAVRDESEQAFYLYERVFERYPNSLDAAKAKLNLGILSYNKREYEETEAYLLAGLEIPHDDYIVTEKMHWYLGNTYINLGNLSDARTHIMIVFSMNAIFKDAAYQALRQLNISLGEWENLQSE